MFLCRILTRSDRIEFLYMVNIELLVKALHKAIVWCDSRAKETVEALVKQTGCRDALRPDCGLPIAEYFSALKIRWLMENEPEIGEKLRNGTALVGTVDSWLVWKMTGRHVTDVTNASRNRVKNSKNIESYSDLWSISWAPEWVKMVHQNIIGYFSIRLRCSADYVHWNFKINKRFEIIWIF